MAVGPLPRISGTLIQQEHVGNTREALLGDFVPRNAEGNVVAGAGNLGLPVAPWLTAAVQRGIWINNQFFTENDLAQREVGAESARNGI